jgi:hypothetical protein
MFRIAQYLDSRLTTGRRFTRQKHYFSASGTNFCQRLSEPQRVVLPEGLGKFINKSPPQVSNPRHSGLQHSALPTTPLRGP